MAMRRPRGKGRGKASVVDVAGEDESRSGKRSLRPAGDAGRVRYDHLGVCGGGGLDKTSASFLALLGVDDTATAGGGGGTSGGGGSVDNGPERIFLPGEGSVLRGVSAEEWTVEYARVNGMSVPHIFPAADKAALGIITSLAAGDGKPGKKAKARSAQHPSNTSVEAEVAQAASDFTPRKVAELVGRRMVMSVLAAKDQSESKMSLEQWADYWDSPVQRENVGPLNLITLEFSNTPLGRCVQPPALVRDIDWIDHTWPSKTDTNEGGGPGPVLKGKASNSRTYPRVQKYCLMSVAGSFTDFHVDFGGTSVWYHLVSGRKIFFLAPPTQHNLRTFSDWTFASDAFLPSLLPGRFSRVELHQGETLFIPAGWIHAVYTPDDSLVFGGNFLHSFDIGTQLRVANMEQANYVPSNMRFPFFTKMIYFTITQYLLELRKVVEWAISRPTSSPPEPPGWTAGMQPGEMASIKTMCHWCKKQEKRVTADKEESVPGNTLRPSFIVSASDFLSFTLDIFSSIGETYARSGPGGLRANASVWKKKGCGRLKQKLLSVEHMPGVNVPQLLEVYPELRPEPEDDPLEAGSEGKDGAGAGALDWLAKLQAQPNWPVIEREAQCRVAREIEAMSGRNMDFPDGRGRQDGVDKKGRSSGEQGLDNHEHLLKVFAEDHSRLHMPLPSKLQEGDRVVAKFRKSIKFFAGTIASEECSKGKEPSYAIHFDDGDFDAHVRRRHIRGLSCGDQWKQDRVELHLYEMVQQEKTRRAKVGSGGARGGGGRKRKSPSSSSSSRSGPTPSKEAPGVKRQRSLTSLNRFIEENLAHVDFQPPPSPPSPPPTPPPPELTPMEQAIVEHQQRVGHAYVANFVAFYSLFSQHEEAMAQQQRDLEAVQRLQQEQQEREEEERRHRLQLLEEERRIVSQAADYTVADGGTAIPAVPEMPEMSIVQEVPMVPLMPGQSDLPHGSGRRKEIHTVMI